MATSIWRRLARMRDAINIPLCCVFLVTIGTIISVAMVSVVDTTDNTTATTTTTTAQPFYESKMFIGLVAGIGGFFGFIILCCIAWKCCCGGKDND